MEPAYRQGSIVVIATRWRLLRRGDVVVFRHQGRDKIKRVAEADGYFMSVLGDNPSESTDSRQFGKLPQTIVLGKVVWPRRKAAG